MDCQGLKSLLQPQQKFFRKFAPPKKMVSHKTATQQKIFQKCKNFEKKAPPFLKGGLVIYKNQLPTISVLPRFWRTQVGNAKKPM